MILWKRKVQTAPDLTNEAYARWLRAGRPPFEWFLGLSIEEQEQLAILGDDHRTDTCIAIGWAVRNPEAAGAGAAAAAGNLDAEIGFVQQLASAALEKMVRKQPKPRPTASGGMRPTGRKT